VRFGITGADDVPWSYGDWNGYGYDLLEYED
jgi:hypothetical protein